MRLINILDAKQASRKSLRKNYNLNFLLQKRFGWMIKYTEKKKIVIELGSGNGFIKRFLGKKVITSDILMHSQIDIKIDMDNFNLPKKFFKKVDIFILNHSLHHSKNPIKLIKKLRLNLKKKGAILINEPEISFVFRLFLKIFNHERWDLNIDNQKKRDFWVENNATGRILFGNKKINSTFIKDLIIKKNETNEFLIFLNSGGNSIEAPHIKLNYTFLNIIDFFDNFITKLFPKVFSLNRSILLKKK